MDIPCISAATRPILLRNSFPEINGLLRKQTSRESFNVVHPGDHRVGSSDQRKLLGRNGNVDGEKSSLISGVHAVFQHRVFVAKFLWSVKSDRCASQSFRKLNVQARHLSGSAHRTNIQALHAIGTCKWAVDVGIHCGGVKTLFYVDIVGPDDSFSSNFFGKSERHSSAWCRYTLGQYAGEVAFGRIHRLRL